MSERHAFQISVPPHLVQRWLGRAAPARLRAWGRL